MLASSASGALTISGTPNIEAKGYLRAMMGSPVKIAGKAFTNASQSVVIVNGKLQSASGLPLALKLGGARFSFEDIKADQSGEGWAWRASDKRLTLNGYSGGGIAAYVDLNLHRRPAALIPSLPRTVKRSSRRKI